jgi:hypothetical protein
MMWELKAREEILLSEEIKVFVTTIAFLRYRGRTSLALMITGEIVSPLANS